MALRIRFQYPTGSKLGYSVERLADGLLYDFAAGTFAAAPATLIGPLPEDSAPFMGRFKGGLADDRTGNFKDGDYCVTVHDRSLADDVVAELSCYMRGGDDATPAPVAVPTPAPPPGPIPTPTPAGTVPSGAEIAAGIVAALAGPGAVLTSTTTYHLSVAQGPLGKPATVAVPVATAP